MCPLVVFLVILTSSQVLPSESFPSKGQSGKIPKSGNYLSKYLVPTSDKTLPDAFTNDKEAWRNKDFNLVKSELPKPLDFVVGKAAMRHVLEDYPFFFPRNRVDDTHSIIPVSTFPLPVPGYHKRDYWTPNRYKRIRVCPFLNRVGFPLGGCLYSYIKPTYKPAPPPPKPTPTRNKPIPRPVIMWQPYQARWPEFYFLGGALGRR